MDIKEPVNKTDSGEVLLTFMDAISTLGFGEIMGELGTDWSWHIKWGTDSYGETVLVDENDVPFNFTYDQYTSKEWIVRRKDNE